MSRQKQRMNVTALAASTLLVVAVAIVGAVLGFSVSVGMSTLTIYDGLARDVAVEIDGTTRSLGPFSTADMRLEMGRDYQVTARTEQGQQIEQFQATPPYIPAP